MKENTYKSQIRNQISLLEQSGEFNKNHDFIQHGSISVYDHCVDVALCSCRIAELLPFHINMSSLIRGALLHDYFLYDWHVKSDAHRLHGFFHPGVALANAERDYDLNPLEKSIIIHHMFPLTLMPPTCREAWIVCLADKICASRETWSGFRQLLARQKSHKPL